jgi:hypothetical protein
MIPTNPRKKVLKELLEEINAWLYELSIPLSNHDWRYEVINKLINEL